jgi:hypothetical protein
MPDLIPPFADERVATAIRAVEQTPGILDRWFDLIALLVELGRHAHALHILEQRHQANGDGMSVAYTGLGRLLLLGKIDPVADFAAQLPPNHAFTPVILMLRAWVATAREKSDEAVKLIRQALQTVPAIKDFVARDFEFQNRNYPHFINQAEQHDLTAEVLALTAPEPAPPMRLDPIRSHSGASRVVVAAADAGYMTRFAGDFLRSFQEMASPDMLLHLHVIEPDSESNALLDELVREEPRLKVSRQTEAVVGVPSVYYACSRFLIAPSLIEHYRLPLLLTDIDITFRRPIGAITRLAEPFDVALFETGSAMPPLRCSAVAVHFAASGPAGRFLALLTRYLGTKLRAGRHWMLDQSAIWAVSRACRNADDAISYGNLAELHGTGWSDFIEPISITPEEKRRMRRR